MGGLYKVHIIYYTFIEYGLNDHFLIREVYRCYHILPKGKKH